MSKPIASCTAVVSSKDRISFVIKKGETGYRAFAKAINAIEAGKVMAWYGDVTDSTGKEGGGLILTRKPSELRSLIRRAAKARNFPTLTCAASRHLQIMGEVLAKGKKYSMLDEEPEYCAESILAVVAALWEARAELAKRGQATKED